MKNLVITPLQEELDALLESLARRGVHHEASSIGRLGVQVFPTLSMVLGYGGHGKTQFGIQTQYLLDQGGNFNLVICAGAAGGLSKGISVGDVIVATTTIEHDYNLRFVTRPLPRFEGDREVIARLQRFHSASGNFKIHFGPVASGDEDIVDSTRAKELCEKTGALAVAWEGAGGARACTFNLVPFVEMRGVTDVANHQAPADYDTNLAIVMNNIADILLWWMSCAHMEQYP